LFADEAGALLPLGFVIDGRESSLGDGAEDGGWGEAGFGGGEPGGYGKRGDEQQEVVRAHEGKFSVFSFQFQVESRWRTV
jgi:hypothetical protein